MAHSREEMRNMLQQSTRLLLGLPGEVAYDPKANFPAIDVIAYDGKKIHEQKITDLNELKPLVKDWHVIWVNVEGLKNKEVIQKIGEMFKVHHLALEDVLTVHQRAKLEQYHDLNYLVCHMIQDKSELVTEQLNIFFNKSMVLTLQDGSLDCLNPARERLRKNTGRVRSAAGDYLVYSLLDCVIDSYFPILERYGDRLEEVEDEIIEYPTRDSIGRIHIIKRNLLTLRRSIWPLREAINSMIRDMPDFFEEETRVHLRDCYDHTVQVLDFVETYRELGADLMDIYLSSISNKMNEVMKVLAVITTICAPPSLIAAIYGMNFDPAVSHFNMPELHWKFGYPYALGLMLFCATVTISIMWWKGWLSAFAVPSRRSMRRERAKEKLKSKKK